ncbi:MAG TPA: class I SAM-dependent methyltransferase [Trebonia sp.]|jgi:O-methyltransferase involved in polyketide biosynthesis|nr:class I SAM-dependent methyltransferase [Trebonia sp.]
MGDTKPDKLGAIQATLFIPLAARARATRGRHPLLHDPKSVEVMAAAPADSAYDYGRGGVWVSVVRTLIFDWWVRRFLAEHPAGTVVELGTGLNSRFERTDNGTVHWIDLDLPDTIALRRRYFADTGRRQMVEASLTSEEWLGAVAELPGPYFFVSDGVLTYLSDAEVTASLTRIAERFPGALLAFDMYARRTFAGQHKSAARRGIDAPWTWGCDDPRELEPCGLRVVESAAITRPPHGLRAELPARYRWLILPLLDPVFGKSAARLALFRAGSA